MLLIWPLNTMVCYLSSVHCLLLPVIWSSKCKQKASLMAKKILTKRESLRICLITKFFLGFSLTIDWIFIISLSEYKEKSIHLGKNLLIIQLVCSLVLVWSIRACCICGSLVSFLTLLVEQILINFASDSVSWYII